MDLTRFAKKLFNYICEKNLKEEYLVFLWLLCDAMGVAVVLTVVKGARFDMCKVSLPFLTAQ